MMEYADGRETWRVGHVRAATTITARMRGLLGTDAGEGVLLLAPCRRIHTYGMRYPIDVAFIDRAGCVVLSRRAVEPGNRIGCRKASMTLERPCSYGDRWFEFGEVLELSVGEES